MKEFLAYGERVEGYDVRVLNEREARAAAGILFVGAFLGLVNGTMLGTPVFSKFFVTSFMIDFIIRVIQPRFSPSLLVGRFFVRNQNPEYVGATQKRFAWLLGMMLAIPMFYFLVIDFQPNPIKVFVCLLCMALLFFESAFSICLGCKIFNLFSKEQSKYCPGGVCEIRRKDPIQTFSSVQKVIFSMTIFAMFYGTYAYFTKLPDKSFFVKKVKTMMLSDEERARIKEKKMQEEFDSF